MFPFPTFTVSEDVYSPLSKALEIKASALAYLNRSFGTASTNGRKKWTFSAWLKYSSTGSAQTIFTGYTPSTGSQTICQKYSDNTLSMYNYISATLGSITPSTTFTDTASYHHHVFVWDSDNATSGDRMRIYVDGTRLSVGYTYPSSGALSYIDTTGLNHSIGRFINKDDTSFTANPLDAKIARPVFVEGFALSANDFGGNVSGTWTSKSVAALTSLASSGDGNSFYLEFDNGGSTTTLGYDKSSKGNNWTLNNMTTSDWVSI